MLKLSYEYIKNRFKDAGCILLSNEYISCLHKLDYICSCGNIAKTIWVNFKKGMKCKKCGHEKTTKQLKHSYEYVKQYFEDQNCELLSTEYKNNNQKLDCVCICGNKTQISFYEFKKGCRCKKCGIKKRSKSQSIDIDKVKETFLKHGCKLLEINNYKNCSTKLKALCKCGEIFTTTYNNIRNGHFCKKCGINKSKNSRKNNGKQQNILNLKNGMLKKYGVENPMQVESLFNKSINHRKYIKWHELITPSGKKIKLQGYEPQAYEKLLEKYTEDEIIIRIKPTILYFFNNKKHYYFPDFFIPKDNLIVEVKSNWTYRKQLGKNLIKRRACIDQGFSFQFMIL